MTDASWEADNLVKVQSENTDRYKRNLLQQAVCEFRFPTLLELGGTRPPSSFVAALRKAYPHLELGNEVTLNIGGESGYNHTHIFRSSKLTWTISLKQNTFSIETTKYTTYEEMKERTLHVVEAASQVIDSDFFTRVGLRYINVVASDTDPVDGWVNPELTAPLLSQRFQGVQDYSGKLQLAAADGGCLLQHGIRLTTLPPTTGETGKTRPSYYIDVDAYRTEVSIMDASVALDAMHKQAFEMFDWAIGDKAREYLSAERTSAKR